jgi:FkbM family methyltransferase
MLLSKIKQHLYPHRILDIGANIGQFHLECKQEFPSSYIFSIEASPYCEEFLRNVTRNYKICLLGKDKNLVDFYVNKSNPISTGNSIYKEMTFHFSEENTVIEKIESHRLDDIFENDYFDLIKIDTQGSEIDIIKGGLDLISRAKGIILEVSITPYNEGAPLHDEVIDFMNSLGYVAKETLEEHYDNGSIFQVDYLFVNENYQGSQTNL